MMKMTTTIKRMLILATALVFTLAACDTAVGPDFDEDEESGSAEQSWIDEFSVDNPGELRVENTSEEKIAVFDGEVAEDQLVGVVGGFESEYRLEALEEHTTVVLQAVRFEELREHIDEPDRAEVVSSELVSVTGERQQVSMSGGVSGDAELAVRNETDELVEVYRGSADGDRLFAMEAGERRTVYLEEGPVQMYPVAVVPVRSGGRIISHRSLELPESARQLELSVGSQQHYTIDSQQTGTDVHAYLRVVNDYNDGVELLKGSELQQTSLSQQLVNPGSRGEYAFALEEGEEKRTTGSLALRTFFDEHDLGEITLERGKVIEARLTASGELEINEAVPQEGEG